MSFRSLIKPEVRRHLRFDDTACRKLHDCFAPSAQAIDLVPHMAEIYAKYAFVRVHETKRVELKPWCTGEHGKHGQNIALLAARQRRSAKHPKSAGRGKYAVPFFP